MKVAMADTEPESSISLPNTAPSRNNGKKRARKSAALPMKVWVQCASRGSRENRAATRAAIGASSNTLQPRNANAIKRASPPSIPASPISVIGSALREQDVEVSGRPSAEIITMACKEFIGAAASLLLEQRDERAFGIQLRRRAELREPIALDRVRPHPGPTCAFATARIGHLAQQRNHAQLLHERRIEGNLVEPVQDLGCGARRVGALARIDLDQDGVVSVRLPDQRRDGGIAGIAAVPVKLAANL